MYSLPIMIAQTKNSPFNVTIDLPSEHNSPTMELSNNDRRLSEPRRSRRSSRRSTMGSISSNSTGGGAISVESSDAVFAAELCALADLPDDDSTSLPMSNTDTMRLVRNLSGLTIDEGSEGCAGFTIDEDCAVQDNEHLIIKKVQSQLLDKHMRTGRLSATSTSANLRTGGRSRNQLGNAAASQRRVRTTLSFGSNIDQVESQSISMASRAMRRNDSWKLGEKSGMTLAKSHQSKSMNTKKAAAVFAGRALLDC